MITKEDYESIEKCPICNNPMTFSIEEDEEYGYPYLAMFCIQHGYYDGWHYTRVTKE
jgi:hypothetical protein